ncbi:hypothetical protein A3746_11940 [Oleibacter sp. HI0075]|nr:hypothetical protein A3746_11940 [Oleibacter sp. HI0075]|tara:strand:- start:97 stop:549 length:453 start_codon:yes stop_codon:yes gene_type:complete
MVERDFFEVIAEASLMFLLALAAGSILPVGSEWYLVLLLEQGAVAWLVTTAAILGNTAGGWLTFALGVGGRKLYERSHELPRRFQVAESLFARYGRWSLLFSWVPLLGDILVGLAGAAKLLWKSSFVLIFIGKALRYLFIYSVWAGLTHL